MKKVIRERKSKGKIDDNDQPAILAAGKSRGQKVAKKAIQHTRPVIYEVEFTFPEPTELVPPVIEVRDIQFNYPNGPTIFKKLNFGIDMSSRICIAGRNGSGKSTLIGLLTKSINPTEGEILFNRHLRIASYKQHFVDCLPLDKTPVEFLCSRYGKKPLEVRSILGKFGLTGSAHMIKMSSLSGGQKARVVFADMNFQNPHIIILDEPSNNLDMQSIRALGEAINNFAGGVIIVSHDQRLITETNCILWVVERYTVLEQVGGIDAYRREIMDKLEQREREIIEIAGIKQAKKNAERIEKLAQYELRKSKPKTLPQSIKQSSIL